MFICDSNHECWLIYFQSVIILILKWFERSKVMAQRRAEKPKKIKISPKQQELYGRLQSSKRWRRKEDTMKCNRCGGFMVYENFYSPVEDFFGWRCISCGEIVDQVILENRISQRGWCQEWEWSIIQRSEFVRQIFQLIPSDVQWPGFHS